MTEHHRERAVAGPDPDAPDAERPGRPRTAAGRRLVGLAIGAWLALHVAIPAHYYLVQDDPHDERFAWRMHSFLQTESCRVSATEDFPVDGELRRRKLALDRLVHRAWQTALKRRRADVMTAWFDRRCEEPGVVATALIRRCRTADGRDRPAERIEHTCPASEAPP